jgi:DNA replicative helicase MCM subunit Mcm2 (Cdc46/Mcm family)
MLYSCKRTTASTSSSKRKKMTKIFKIIKNLQEENDGDPVDIDTIIERAGFDGITEERDVKNAIETLKNESQIIEKRNGKFLVLKS